jgi:hypothetical protein
VSVKPLRFKVFVEQFFFLFSAILIPHLRFIASLILVDSIAGSSNWLSSLIKLSIHFPQFQIINYFVFLNILGFIIYLNMYLEKLKHLIIRDGKSL